MLRAYILNLKLLQERREPLRLLPALAQRRRGAFAEFGAVDMGHAAGMGEAEIEGDIDHPLAGAGLQQPRVELFQTDILQHGGYRLAEMTLEAELQRPNTDAGQPRQFFQIERLGRMRLERGPRPPVRRGQRVAMPRRSIDRGTEIV